MVQAHKGQVPDYLTALEQAQKRAAKAQKKTEKRLKKASK